MDTEEPAMRHPKFDWEGFDQSGTALNLSLHAIYPANATAHRLIVEHLKRTVENVPDIALFTKKWRDEGVRATTASFIRRQLCIALRAANRLHERGDLQVWIEIEP